MSNIKYFLFLSIFLLSACGAEDRVYEDDLSLSMSAEKVSALTNDWCEIRGKYSDGTCDHCPRWDSDCPSPDAWGRQSPSSNNVAEGDWCEIRGKYNDGTCDHCPRWDSDCPSPDAWGRTSPARSQSVVLESTGSVSLDSGRIHDRNNEVSGLILPLEIEQISPVRNDNEFEHKFLFVGDSNMETPYLEPDYGDGTIPIVRSDQRISSVFAKLKGLSFGSKRSAFIDNEALDVINWGIGGASTRYFLNNFPTHKSQYVIICLGLNERRMFPLHTPLDPILRSFKSDTIRLIRKFEAQNTEVILMTNVYQDAINGHQASRMSDNIITSFDNVYREISESLEQPLVDVNIRMRALANQGKWDFRRRVRNRVPILDHRFDHQETANFRWFGDAHYNSYGAKVVAEELARQLDF